MRTSSRRAEKAPNPSIERTATGKPYHVNMRLAQRYIARRAILDAVDGYELVEAYPQDKYLPSYLVLAKHAGGAFQE